MSPFYIAMKYYKGFFIKYQEYFKKNVDKRYMNELNKYKYS